jgi:type IV secretion system protein VirD4
MNAATRIAIWFLPITYAILVTAGILANILLGKDPLTFNPVYIFALLAANLHLKQVKGKILIALFVPIVLFLLAFFIKPVKARADLHGSARWAKNADIIKANLFNRIGILLGKVNSKFLVADGTEHAMVAAPTRSGKGVGVVIPNCLRWQGSLLVLDMKLEAYNVTSKFRKKCGNEVYVFSPSSKESHCFNVFDTFDLKDKQRIAQIQNIAMILCPNPKGDDPMWATEGRNIFTGITLYLIDSGQKVSLPHIYMFLMELTEDRLNTVVDSLDPQTMDILAIGYITAYSEMGEKQQSGVKSSIASTMQVFGDPYVAAATVKSDFDLRDLKKRKMTIYVGVSPSEIERVKPILNLFFQYFFSIHTKTLPRKDEPYKVLALLDEFTALGKMDIVKNGIAYFAGYNIRLMIIIQGRAQLVTLYEQSGTSEFLTNFMYRMYYPPNDFDDAKKLSDELGQETERAVSVTPANGKGTTSRSISMTGRNLLLPNELMQMARTDGILFVEASPPILIKKTVYYEDKHFNGHYYNLHDTEATKSSAPDPIPAIDVNGYLQEMRDSAIRMQAENEDTEDTEGLDIDAELQELADDDVFAEIDENDPNEEQINLYVEQFFSENVEITDENGEILSQEEVKATLADLVSMDIETEDEAEDDSLSFSYDDETEEEEFTFNS